MTNEENKDEIRDVSSLISLLDRKKLTLGEKLALEENVSLTYERLLHKRHYQNGEYAVTNKYSTYVLLIQRPPEILGNIVDCILEQGLSTEEDIEEILMYIRSGIVPYHLWVSKVIEDVKRPGYFFKRSSLPGMLTVYLVRTMRCSLIGYRKLVTALREEFADDDKIMEVVNFVESRYMEVPKVIKEDYMKLVNTDSNKKRYEFLNSELSLFTEVLVDMMKYPLDYNIMTNLAVEDLGIFQKLWIEPALTDLLNAIPSEDEEGGNVTTKIEGSNSERREEDEQGGGRAQMSFFPVDLLGWGPNGETPEEWKAILEKMKKQNQEEGEPQVITKEPAENKEDDVAISNEPKGYELLKVAKDSSNRVVSRKFFPTKEQAESFRKFVLEQDKNLEKSFDFRIQPKF